MAWKSLDSVRSFAPDHTERTSHLSGVVMVLDMVCIDVFISGPHSLDSAGYDDVSPVAILKNQVLEKTIVLSQSSQINCSSHGSLVTNDQEHSTCSMCQVKPATVKLTVRALSFFYLMFKFCLFDVFIFCYGCGLGSNSLVFIHAFIFRTCCLLYAIVLRY